MEPLLSKKGYDPFIDYLKGVCIIFVIMTHCTTSTMQHDILFCLWGDMAVPLLLMLQVFQTYKKGLSEVKINIRKTWDRIFFPFLLAELIAVAGLLLLSKGNWHVLRQFGDIGPGAYYPYIYLQFMLLLYFLVPVVKKLNLMWLCVAFLVMSQVLEYVSIYSNLSSDAYRFLFFRYFFLLFLGYLLLCDKIELNAYTIVLSIISILCILTFEGSYWNLNKLGDVNLLSSHFYLKGWRIFHWVSYPFVAFLLLPIFKWSYNLICQSKISAYLQQCGKWSYEIFLFQMLFFAFNPVGIMMSHLGFGGVLIDYMSLFIDVLICTIPIILIKRYVQFRQVYK